MNEIYDCADVVNARREKIGMTIRALSKRSRVDENALYLVLSHKRKMLAWELLSVSFVLGLTLDDYRKEVS